MRTIPTRIRIATIAAAAGAVLVACGGGSTSKARPAAAAQTTTTDVNAKIIADYRAFEDMYRQLVAAPDPHSPTLDATLAQHATGDEYGHLHLVLLDLARRGQVVKGPASELHPRVVSVDGNTAIIDDCSLDHGHHYDAKTGALADQPGDTTHNYETTLLLDAGTWKVAKVADKGGTCAP